MSWCIESWSAHLWTEIWWNNGTTKKYDVPIGVVLDDDRNDSGPNLLQNTYIPIDTFEGVTKINDSTTDQTENYFMEVDAV